MISTIFSNANIDFDEWRSKLYQRNITDIFNRTWSSKGEIFGKTLTHSTSLPETVTPSPTASLTVHIMGVKMTNFGHSNSCPHSIYDDHNSDFHYTQSCKLYLMFNKEK